MSETYAERRSRVLLKKAAHRLIMRTAVREGLPYRITDRGLLDRAAVMVKTR